MSAGPINGCSHHPGSFGDVRDLSVLGIVLRFVRPVQKSVLGPKEVPLG